MLDLIIKDGLIIDGTGRAAFRGDVGVSGERIVAVGEVASPARRTLSAEGLLVTPGFVDIHTHFDGQASWDSELAPSSNNGVTSVVMGNCGVGFAPARADKHDWLINLLEGVEDIPGTALAEGLTWDWETFPDYLDALARRRYSMDVGAYLPHAALRTYVMGDRGADHAQHPSDAEIDDMAALTAEALKAGALGFSTSRTRAHMSRDGRNIGTLHAGARELLGVARALRQSGLGVIQLISDAYQHDDEDAVEAELRLIRALAEGSGRPLAFSLMQVRNAPGRWKHLLAAADHMTRDGLDVHVQVGPRPIGAIMSLASSLNPFLATEAYKALAALPFEARIARLRESEVKRRMLSEFAELRRSSGYWDPRYMFRMADPVDYDPAPDRCIAAEAAQAGREVEDHLYDVLLENEGRQVLWLASLNFVDRDLRAVHEMLTHPHALFGLSDAGAHVATIVDGTFPTTTLTLWGRGSGNRDGLHIPLEALVHGYTQRNAAFVGWRDRGVVGEGYLADLNVIDLAALDVAPPRLVSDLPAGGSRYLQGVRGYRHTIKRGRVTRSDGAATGELPGRLMRGAQEGPA
jgi:N-acyl-D-aspartate/D-glutamate deacylase